MTAAPEDGRTHLAPLLLRRSRWFDEALLARLAARGYPEITPTQTLVFALLPPDGIRPSDLARQLGVTRQTVHQYLQSLMGAGLLVLGPDPTSGRSKLIVLTETGRGLVAAALEELNTIERELAARVGPETLERLRQALATDWGAPPVS